MATSGVSTTVKPSCKVQDNRGHLQTGQANLGKTLNIEKHSKKSVLGDFVPNIKKSN